jgi:cysteine desulfuration protein SufE
MLDTFQSCLGKQEELKTVFQHCVGPEAIYQKLIELGKKLPPFPESEKIPENVVSGCQSLMYLSASQGGDGLITFRAGSEALISAGLAAVLIKVYSGETPEAVLKCPPLFLTEIGIQTSLTPSRSDGLASLFLKIKQKALNFLINTNN